MTNGQTSVSNATTKAVKSEFEIPDKISKSLSPLPACDSTVRFVTDPMAGTLQTLLLIPPSTRTLSLPRGTPRFPSNHALFCCPSIAFKRNRSICRPVGALERPDQVRTSLIPPVLITCLFSLQISITFSYTFLAVTDISHWFYGLYF